MEEILVQTRNIQPIVDGIKPLITSSNEAFVNSRYKKKAKSKCEVLIEAKIFFETFSLLLFVKNLSSENVTSSAN